MTRPAAHDPFTYMCAVCWEYNNRQRKAQWLTAFGWHVCDEHRDHAETYGAATMQRKP